MNVHWALAAGREDFTECIIWSIRGCPEVSLLSLDLNGAINHEVGGRPTRLQLRGMLLLSWVTDSGFNDALGKKMVLWTIECFSCD